MGWGLFIFLRGRRARGAAAPDFYAAAPLVPHAAVELTLRRQPHLGRIEGRCRGIFVAGNQGFSVRFALAPGVALEAGTPGRVEVQFLKPELALAHLPAGAEFSMLQGKHLVADGRVAKWGP